VARLWTGGCGVGNDLRLDVGLFEVAIFCADDDLAIEEKEDVHLELGAEADWKPDGTGSGIGLRCVDDREAEAGKAGAEQGANGKGNLARHGGADEHGLIGGCVDVGVAFP
jgi:hypothetical protein